MDRFKLSEKLRMFLMIENGFRHPYLGVRLPISIRANWGYSQSLWIFPELNCKFFTRYEVERLLWVAKSLELEFNFTCASGVPVIEIEDYSIKHV
jgi:hypothetical protein